MIILVFDYHNQAFHVFRLLQSFQKAAAKGVEILNGMAMPVKLSDRESLLKSAATSLNSKVVSQYSSFLSPLAVDAVLKVLPPAFGKV